MLAPRPVVRSPAVVALVGSVAVLVAIIATGADPHYGVLVVLAATAATARRQAVVSWRSLLVALLLIVLFLPIKRYTVSSGLPFQLEPYRLYVGLLALGWAASLLADRRVRLRRSGLGKPLVLVLLAAVASDIANPGRVAGQQLASDVAKSLMFFVSFLVVFWLVVSVVERFSDLEALLRVLVGGGAVLAALGLVEAATGFNPFDHLHSVLPFLHKDPTPYYRETIRGGRLRILASAQHPIALSALFVIQLPVAIYLARATHRRRWTAAAWLLLLGVFATESRTGIVMLTVVLLVYLRLRPRETLRLWRWVVPALIAIHLAVPGSIGALTQSFLPQGGIVKQEEAGAGTRGSGRLADLGPGLAEWRGQPLFGEGFGTRITDVGPKHNAPILDDQWLGTLLETGVVGVAGWLWVFGAAYRRLSRAARADGSERGWLYAGLAASIVAFAAGMLTYDAFSFVQVTFVFFLLLAFASVALQVRQRRASLRSD
jgi:hypothetical protein